MRVQVGTAPDSWGVWFPNDPLQIPWPRCLDEIAEAGYEWIELGPYGYFPRDLVVLRGELNRRGLKVCAATAIGPLEDPAAWTRLEEQVCSGGTLAAELGGKFLVLIDECYTNVFTGQPVAPRELCPDAWKRLIESTHCLAERSRSETGLHLVFHPHAESHVEHEWQIQSFLEQTDPNLVSLCLDTGHHAYCGGDPVTFMRLHHKRIPYLHLKSVDADMRKRTEEESIPLAKAVAMDVFCEPALGLVDFAAFRDALREINYVGWGIVEQDMYPAPFDKPLPIARRTRDYLKTLGIG
jgi:inosose dehydratase